MPKTTAIFAEHMKMTIALSVVGNVLILRHALRILVFAHAPLFCKRLQIAIYRRSTDSIPILFQMKYEIIHGEILQFVFLQKIQDSAFLLRIVFATHQFSPLSIASKFFCIKVM